MAYNIIKYAFIAGEISPTLFGRTDLTKFDLGMAEATNFFVDYRGGLSTRPGTRFQEFVKDDQEPTRFVRFVFSPDAEDTYILLFGNNYIRFLQGGNYVLRPTKNIISATQANPVVLGVTGHGYSIGDWVAVSGVVGMTELNGKKYRISATTANTITLQSLPDQVNLDGTGYTAYTAGGTVAKVYEVATTYSGDDLANLAFCQYRDQLIITSADFPIKKLVRLDHDSWTLSAAVISNYEVGPTITGESLSAAGSAQTLFGVTSVFADGSESIVGEVYKLDLAVNYPVTEGSVSITWAADADALSYNVYRSVVSVSESLSYGMELGYAGNTRGTKFTDPNILVDFTRTPPNNYNPFAPGAIVTVEVTAGGSGYVAGSTTVSAGGGGTGFAGQVIVNDSGAVTHIVIKNGGEGYTAPTITITGAGTLATATATARDTTGTYPSLSAIFQQRQIYAASDINPITIWGSQYKRFDNFNFSTNLLDTDSFEFDLDTDAVSPIKHLVSTRGGLLALTQDNIWLVSGGTDKAITPSSAIADPQTYNGVSALQPLRVGEDLLYVEGKGYAVRLLGYSEISRVYAGEDKSILSSHLFGAGKELISWDYQESPYKVVYAVREDGIMLSFTIVKSEDVFAWTPWKTRGEFKDVISVQEGPVDAVYATVFRVINGRRTLFIERLDLRQFNHVEDAWCVDCGLSLDGTAGANTITLYQDTPGVYEARRTTGTWTSGDVGKILRAAGGVFEVTALNSATELALSYRTGTIEWMPETDDAYTRLIAATDWTLDTPVTTLSGLWHLEGETVSILGDGNVFPQQVVTDGAVVLTSGVTRAIVGLPFTCKAKTLPLFAPDRGVESNRKRVVALDMRLKDSRGLRAGDDYDRTYEIPERSNEVWGAPTDLQQGFKRLPIGTTWDEDSFTYFLLTDPLPTTLLSLVQETEVGDDPN